jgi:cytochrome c oxidase subunit 2
MKPTYLPAPAAALLLGSCNSDPMTFMHSHGDAAHSVTALGWGATILCLGILAVISALLLIALFRRRPEPQPGGALVEAQRRAIGMRWIYIGVGSSTVLLIALYTVTLITLAAVARPRQTPALTIEINAHQWWWEARYDDGNPADVFITANELHIPVHTPVEIELASADVLHSFWVPQLAGKTDVVPGQTNHMWIEADSAATYRGQCGEYCGLQHAHMAFDVVAQSADDFRAWRARQLRESREPTDASAEAGMAVFRQHCAACHTVRGTDAAGLVGPDLTHVMSRATIASGTLPNMRGYLAGWISDAQGAKPGAHMPTMSLSGNELQAVLSFIGTLE